MLKEQNDNNQQFYQKIFAPFLIFITLCNLFSTIPLYHIHNKSARIIKENFNNHEAITQCVIDRLKQTDFSNVSAFYNNQEWLKDIDNDRTLISGQTLKTELTILNNQNILFFNSRFLWDNPQELASNLIKGDIIYLQTTRERLHFELPYEHIYEWIRKINLEREEKTLPALPIHIQKIAICEPVEILRLKGL